MGKLKGVYIVMATPFLKDGAIDFDGVTKNLEHYIKVGAHGVMVAGALGEYLTMTFDERKALVEHVAKVIDGRIPFTVGTIAHRTEDVIDLTNHAGAHGAAGVMILPPPGTGLMEDEIIAFYKDVTAAITTPVLLYNNPGSAGMDMDFDVIKEIADFPNVDAIKEASGDIKRITRISTELKGKLTPFCGWEDMHHESFLAGAKGWVCMGANFAPGLTRDIFELAESGDIVKARALTDIYTPLARYLETAGKVTQTTKYIMGKVGLVGGEVRAPRLPLTEEEMKNIDAVLESIELY
ncbi:dihydrodipicolinate synthase family protein [Desulfoluna sp.]|uniref:dihydrodipicolinate synthase family protein n=1 Tax=Desulfoluna sp. TaxID=2045199 RepID=UPI002631408E|nr:dihydrodipicolinate synthase family protein [Desulfoluna sp.]